MWRIGLLQRSRGFRATEASAGDRIIGRSEDYVGCRFETTGACKAITVMTSVRWVNIFRRHDANCGQRAPSTKLGSTGCAENVAACQDAVSVDMPASIELMFFIRPPLH